MGYLLDADVAVTRLYVLVFIEHRTRRLHVGGVPPTRPARGPQQARNLALDLGERFGAFRFLIRARGSNFAESYDAVFQAAAPPSCARPCRRPG
jgi:putative transposase